MRDGNVPKRQYTDEFKIEAIRLSDSVGGHEAARRLGIPTATLSNWSRKRRPVDWWLRLRPLRSRCVGR